MLQPDTKVNETQKDKLLSLVRANFLEAVGRFTGADGAEFKKVLWNRFAHELNQLGPPRTAKEWKTVNHFAG